MSIANRAAESKDPYSLNRPPLPQGILSKQDLCGESRPRLSERPGGFGPLAFFSGCHPERGLFFAPKRKEQPQSKDPYSLNRAPLP